MARVHGQEADSGFSEERCSYWRPQLSATWALPYGCMVFLNIYDEEMVHVIMETEKFQDLHKGT